LSRIRASCVTVAARRVVRLVSPRAALTWTRPVFRPDPPGLDSGEG
jgi:hypothetical protein